MIVETDGAFATEFSHSPFERQSSAITSRTQERIGKCKCQLDFHIRLVLCGAVRVMLAVMCGEEQM